MPAGIENPVLGYMAFTSIKFIGYSLFYYGLSKFYTSAFKWPWYSNGGIRCLIGMIVGVPFGLISNYDPAYFLPIYLSILLILRFGEWYVSLSLSSKQMPFSQKAKLCVPGVFASYLLDLPALFGFLIAGGFWVC
jgi:hypothetical protein